MGKIINLSAVLEKEEKLQQVVDYMEELKDQFSDLIQEYEDDGADVRKVDTLTEALDNVLISTGCTFLVYCGDFVVYRNRTSVATRRL